MTRGVKRTASSTRLQMTLGLLAACLMITSLGCAAGNASRPRGSRGSGDAESEQRIPLIPEAYHYYTAGNMYAAAGNDSAAIETYRRALSYDIDSREIRMALAHAYARRGRYDEAAITAETIKPREPDVLEFLAGIYARMRDFPRRVQMYEEWSRLDSTNVSVWHFLVNAYGATRDTVRQIAALERMAQLRPDPKVLEELGFLQLQAGESDAAETNFHKAMSLDSTQKATKVMLGLAQIWIERDDPDSAYGYFSAAVSTNYYNAELRKRFVYFLLQQMKTDEAMEHARLVLQMTPAEPDILYRLAILEYNAEQLDSAEIHLTQLVTEFADDAMARLLLGRIAVDNGDTVTGEAQYEQSLLLADTIPDPYLSLGFLYDRRNAYDTSIALYEKGLQNMPDQPGLLFALGAALERRGEFDSSVTVFEHLIEMVPDHAPALNYLGYMFADKNVRLKEALALIEKAVSIHPKNGAYLDSHGWVLYRLGRTRRAADKLLEALEVTQSDAVIYEHLGDVLKDLGRHDEAQQYWRQALELEPENAAIQKKLEH